MAESADEDVGGLAGQSSNKVVKKARIKPHSKPTTRQSTGATKKVARKLFETASFSDDNIEHQSGQLTGIDRVLSRLEDLTKAVTESISVAQATRSIPETSSVSQLRREDIGRFNPAYPDPKEAGMIIDGNTIIFTDVNRFVERVESFLQDPVTYEANMRQMSYLFEVLLDGPAAMWWGCELSEDQRAVFRGDGLSHALVALKVRFETTPNRVLDASFFGLDLEGIAADENKLLEFFQLKLKYGRATHELARDNGNWEEFMDAVLDNLYPEIADNLPCPSSAETLDEYMQNIDAKKGVIKYLASKLCVKADLAKFSAGPGY